MPARVNPNGASLWHPNRLAIAPFATLALLVLVRIPVLLSARVSNLGGVVFIRTACQQSTTETECHVPGDLASVMSLFEQALAMDSRNSRARARLGDLQWELGDREAAVALWQEATDRSPADSLTWLRLGTAYKEFGADDEALEAWRRAGAQGVSSLLVRQGIGARKSNNIQEALAKFCDAVTLMPSSALANYVLAELYQQLGMLEQSAVTWSKVATLYSENVWQHWWAIGEAAQIRLQWGVAAEAYTSGAPLSPEPEIFYRRLGQVLETAGDPESALVAYQKAVSVAPEQIAGYLAIGALEWKLGNLGFARGWYKSMAQKFPDAVRPYQWLGVIAYQQGEFGESIGWLELAHRKDPHNVEVLSHLAASYYASRELGLAIESLEQAVHLASPSVPKEWYDRLRRWRGELSNAQWKPNSAVEE